MNYIIATFLLFLLAIICYKKFNREIMSPSVITCLIFSLSFLGAFLGTAKNSWNNIENIHFKTMLVIFIGVLSFIYGEFLARKYKKRTTKKERKEPEENISSTPHYIRLNILKHFLIFCFIILTFILLYLNLKSLVGGESLPQIVRAYKSSSVLYNENALEEGIALHSIVLNMIRFCEMLGIVFIYIIMKNLVNKDKIVKNYRYIFTLIFIAFVTMLVGGRTILLKYFMAGFMIWSIFYMKTHKISLKKFFKIALKVIIVFIPVCYFALPLLGGKNNSSFIDYVTFYLGSQIPALDLFLDSPISASAHFGQMTLKGIQMFLSKFGLIEYWSAYQSEWVYFTSELYTNVFTEFKPFFQDFGYSGIIICTFLFGFVFSILYINAKEKKNICYLIFFAYFSNLLIDQARIEVFYNTFLSARTGIYIVSMLLITYFLFGKSKTKSGEIG